MNRFLVLSFWLISSFATAQSLTQWSEFYDTVKKDLRADQVSVQVEAIAKFASQDYDKSAEFLVGLIQKERAGLPVMRKAAEVLAGYKDERAVRLFEAEVRHSPGKSYFLLLGFLMKDQPDGPEIAFRALNETREPAVRRVAIEGLANQSSLDERGVERLIGFLSEDTYHAVRKAAAFTLGHVKSTKQIEPLIAALTDKVIGDRARDALLRLTGETHWRDQDAWKKWWQTNAATFSPEPMSDDAFAKVHEKLMEEKGDNAMMVEFYEREITGKNIVFLLDRSGSMGQMAPDSGVSRMEKLKGELSFVVDRLDENYSLGFVMFPHDTFPNRGIEKMNKIFREKAGKYVEDLEPNGGTPLGKAVKHTYTKIVAKENVDTIYLLSDGEPSDTTADELLQEMLGYTDTYGVTVNTISIGTDSDLLKKIAKATGGQYWEVQ